MTRHQQPAPHQSVIFLAPNAPRQQTQPHVHATGIALDGGVDKFFDFSKRDDLVELAYNLSARHAKDGSIEEYVLAPAQLGMKSCAHFEQARQAATHFDTAFAGGCNAAESFEQRAFAGAVAADDADDFAGLDFEVDVLQGPEPFFFFGLPPRLRSRLSGALRVLVSSS